MTPVYGRSYEELSALIGEDLRRIENLPIHLTAAPSIQ